MVKHMAPAISTPKSADLPSTQYAKDPRQYEPNNVYLTAVALHQAHSQLIGRDNIILELVMTDIYFQMLNVL
jgi:hypothetical protein